MSKMNFNQTLGSPISLLKENEFNTSTNPNVRSRLNFLALSSIELSDKNSGYNMLNYLSVKSLEIIQKGIVAVALYDLEKGKWQVVSLEGLHFLDKKIFNLWGNKFQKMEGKILPDFMQTLKIGKLVKQDLDFEKLTGGNISNATGNQIIDEVGVAEIYNIPFATSHNFFGTLTILVLNDTPKVDKELIEAFVLQFSAFYEKQRANKKQEESEIKYYKLFDAANVGVSVSTKDGRILEANKAACDLIEHKKEELTELRVKDLYFTDDDRLKLVSLISDKGEVDNFPVQFKTKSGNVKWINLSLKSIYLRNEECYISTFIDITSTKKMELALLNSEEELRKYIDESPISILIVTKEGNIEYLNEKFTSVFGYTKDDLKTINDWWLGAFHDESDRRNAIRKWYQIIKNDHVQVNCNIDCKSGKQKVIELYTTIVDDKVIAMFSDQTEKNRLEQENMNYRVNLEKLVKNRTAELEEKNKQLERMNELFVGREFRIRELKEKVKVLEKKMELNQ